MPQQLKPHLPIPAASSIPTLKDLNVAGQLRCYGGPPIEFRDIGSEDAYEIDYTLQITEIF